MVYIQWGFKQAVQYQSKGQSVLLRNLDLLSHCFYPLGILQLGWAREELLAVQGSTCCLHPWRDFSGCRKQEGSKAASSKIKECDISEYLTAWKALLCSVLPFIFLSVNIWLLKLFLVWKPWSNLLLLKPPSPCSVFSVLMQLSLCELLCFQPLILAGL